MEPEAMKPIKIEKIRIIFNDDGTDSFDLGGESIEFGDIRESVDAIRAALVEKGFKVIATPLRSELLEAFVRCVNAGDEDLIFNLCEGAFGLSDLEMNVAALLELYDLRFTGSGSLTLGVSLNKGWTKDILKSAGVPTAGYRVVEKLPGIGAGGDAEGELSIGLDFPLIVKPLKEDASLGIEEGSVVTDANALRERVDHVIKEYGQPALVEEYVDGREFNISVLGNGDSARALPPAEIDFSSFPEGTPRICSYEAKWIEESPLYIDSPPVCPADVTPELAGELERVALKAYTAMGCRDYARVDMRQGPGGKLFVLEVNPNPDISTDAGLARAARASGLDYSALIAEVVSLATERYRIIEEVEADSESSLADEAGPADEAGVDRVLGEGAAKPEGAPKGP